MIHTRSRRVFAPRPVPIRITPFRKGVANRLCSNSARPLPGPFSFYYQRRFLSISAALWGGFLLGGVHRVQPLPAAEGEGVWLSMLALS